MKGDIVIKKKYVDVIKDFFLGETTTPAFWILLIIFWMASIIIQMALIPMLGYIDTNVIHGAVSSMQTTWTFYGWFIIYQGNVCMDGLYLMWSLDTLVFPAYIFVVVACDVGKTVIDFYKDEL